MKNSIAITVIMGSVSIALMQGQTEKSVWDGVYSPLQATRGATAYALRCASCHSDDLEGAGQNPGLTGAGFRKEWDGKAVADLFDRIRISMPADNPGSLTRAENADIVAFILKTNGYPAGSAELKSDADSLKVIRVVAVKPK